MTKQDLVDEIDDLNTKLAIAIEALKFVCMPISTAKEKLTIDGLLNTMYIDIERAEEALAKIKGLE